MQLLPWIVAVISLMLLSASLAAWVWRSGGRRERSTALPTDWDVASRPVFSSSERQLYRALREALPHHVLLPRLALVRFCQPTDPNEAPFWHRLLGTSQVSFAICSENGRVLTAIDIDSDRSPSRRETQIKRSVLGACRVRYLRCAVDQLPSAAELQWLVPRAGVPSPPPGNLAAARQAPVTTLTTTPGSPAAAARRAFWEDPPAFQDSFFGAESRFDAAVHADPQRFSAVPPATRPQAHPARPNGLASSRPHAFDPERRVVVEPPPEEADDVPLGFAIQNNRRRSERRTSGTRR